MQFIEPLSQPNQPPVSMPAFLSRPITEKTQVQEKANQSTFNGSSAFLVPSGAPSSRSAPALAHSQMKILMI